MATVPAAGARSSIFAARASTTSRAASARPRRARPPRRVPRLSGHAGPRHNRASATAMSRGTARLRGLGLVQLLQRDVRPRRPARTSGRAPAPLAACTACAFTTSRCKSLHLLLAHAGIDPVAVGARLVDLRARVADGRPELGIVEQRERLGRAALCCPGSTRNRARRPLISGAMWISVVRTMPAPARCRRMQRTAANARPRPAATMHRHDAKQQQAPSRDDGMVRRPHRTRSMRRRRPVQNTAVSAPTGAPSLAHFGQACAHLVDPHHAVDRIDARQQLARAAAETPGSASAGQDTPTRKNCGRLLASTSSTAVSRWRNTWPSAWPRKLVARMNGKESAASAQMLPSVENP